MGGEAMKALAIYRELKRRFPDTVQITHERNRQELVERLNLRDVHYVEDTLISLFLWRSIVLRWFLDVWFSYCASRLADEIIHARDCDQRTAVVFQTEPNSPVLPRWRARLGLNVFGPLNGNIYFPPAFRSHEQLRTKIRRVLHRPAQAIHRMISGGLKKADLLLVAGGDRTAVSLLAAGCSPKIMHPSLDCGLPDELLQRRRIHHSGRNVRFVHFGRLVFHKGTHLAIRALTRTKLPICLDIIGSGPELESLRKLVTSLGLSSRVQFREWFPRHSDLIDSLASYRGIVLPSLEDANGIVVQECMAVGLPAVCLDWGGPSLLIKDGESGFLVCHSSLDQALAELATRMDELADRSELAESISISARSVAENWRWQSVIDNWTMAILRAVPKRQ